MLCHVANVYLVSSYCVSFPSQGWTVTENMFNGFLVVSTGSALRVVRLIYVVEMVSEFFDVVCPQTGEDYAYFPWPFASFIYPGLSSVSIGKIAPLDIAPLQEERFASHP